MSKVQISSQAESSNIPLKKSHWFNENCGQFGRLENETHFDIAVIGGGFAGLTSAINLKELYPDKRVAVLEAKHLGYGASGRSGGWVEAFPPLYWLSDDLSQHTTKDNYSYAIQSSRSFMQNLSSQVGNELNADDWKISKHQLFARNLLERATLRWLKSRLDILQMANEYTEYNKDLTHVGYPTIANLTWNCICINPYKMIQLLQSRCSQLKIEIYENTSVQKIDHLKNPLQLELQSGIPITADKLIIATNAYTSQMNLSDKRPFTFVRHTYMISTAPLSDQVLDSISYQQQPFGDPVHSYYSGRFHNKRFLFNGSDLPSRAQDLDDRRLPAYQRLITELFRRFPFLQDTPIESAWGGPTLQTPSDAPIIKCSDTNPNLIYNIGFGGGSGICMALQSGRMVGPLAFPELLKDSAELARLRRIWTQSRFPIFGPVRTVGGVMKYLLSNKII